MKTTRKAAILSGESWYYTGKPCKNGHLSRRYTLNGICEECRILTAVTNRNIFMAARDKAKE
jgi:hypothetical protein